MVRLWVNDEDYGTMTERAVRAEPVADDAPDFLPHD
jgi:hypothetical protein